MRVIIGSDRDGMELKEFFEKNT
ncbi:hypothetical protein MFLO_09142 [Listeria floridensis FSL S10-1187]|uniref:Uncharacterized protein n=1 Tax=Listeria floridensis FSL S10-1187 TaxID=1265817 RepID=A0ABN0REP8_9LIST|nr:hypothetical protein MFLO_09142 [Listeria floridensis FSL S10-1187]